MFLTIGFSSGLRAALLSGIVATLASASTAAAQGDVSLDNLRITLPEGKSTLSIPHVEVTNTNLSRDEVARLFSSDVTKDEARALLSRMTADKISIPESVLSETESRVTFGPLQATGISEGQFKKASLGGFKGTFSSEKTGEGNIASGPIELDDGNLAGLLAATGVGEASGAKVRLGRISWTGLDASFPDKETPKTAPGGNLWHVRLESLTAATEYNGAVPAKSSGDVHGLTVEPPKASKVGQSLATFGYERLDLGFALAATYDSAARALTLQNYSLSGAGAGTLGLSGLFGSLDPAVFTAVGPDRVKALAAGDVSEFRARFVNQGLMEKTLAFFAAQQKKTVDAVKADWAAMTTQIVPIMLGGDPSSLALAQSLQSFINNPKNLTITLKSRGAAVPLAQLPSIKDPATFLALVEVTAKANE